MTIVLGGVFCVARQAPAQSALWATATSGSFTTAGNWNPAFVPGPGGSAIFDLGSTGYTVSLPSGSGTVSIGALDLRNDTVSFDLDQSTLAVSTAALAGTSGGIANFTLTEGAITAGTFGVGLSGSGTMLVDNGATIGVTNDTQVGSNSGSSGQLTLTDNGTQWSSGTFTVGNGGTGTMLVENGATVSVTNGTQVGSNSSGSGQLTLTGAGTQWKSGAFVVGNQGTATMLVEDGATVSVAKTTQLGGSINVGPRQLTITGAGTQWSSGAFIVGNGGSATTLVENGAVVSVTNETQLGGNNAASVGQLTLTDAGTQWSSGAFTVGNNGSGTMLVENGAVVSVTNDTQLGSNIAGSGQLTLTGAGTQWSSGEFLIGNGGSGTMIVENGAVVSVTNDTQLGSNITGSGQLTLTGAGTQWNSGSFGIGNNASGTVLVESGAIVSVTGATTIASAQGTLGQLTLTGAATQWTSGNMVIYSNGLLKVADGASVTTATMQFNGGTVDVSGGGLVTVGLSSAGSPPSFGTVQVTSGGLLQAGGAITGSVVNGGGQVEIPLIVQSSPFPMFVPLTVSGDYTQLSGGILSMYVIGSVTNPSELDVNGNVSLGGVLQVIFIDNAAHPLVVGQTYDLVMGGGSFSTAGLVVEVTGVPAGFGYTTQLAGGVYSLTITSVPEPGTFALGVSAMVGFMIWRRRGSRKNGV